MEHQYAPTLDEVSAVDIYEDARVCAFTGRENVVTLTDTYYQGGRRTITWSCADCGFADSEVYGWVHDYEGSGWERME